MGWIFGKKKNDSSNSGINIPPEIPRPSSPSPISKTSIESAKRHIPKAPLPKAQRQKEAIPSFPYAGEELDLPDLDQPQKMQIKEATKSLKEKPSKLLDIEEPITIKSRPRIPSFDLPEKEEIHTIPDLNIEPEEQIEEGVTLEKGNVAFIEAKTFEEMKKEISSAKDCLSESDKVAARLNEIKNKEDEIYSSWYTSLKQIERKLSYIEASLFK